MQVLLKRTFLCPGGYRIRRSVPVNNPVYVPDVYRDKLPSDAVVIEEKMTPAMEKAGIKSGADLYDPIAEAQMAPETLSEAARLYGGDTARAASDTAQVALEKATATEIEAAKEQAAAREAAKK